MTTLFRRHRMAFALAAVAAVLCGLAYQWFAAQYLRPFEQRAAEFNGHLLQLPQALAGPGPIRFVHFYDPTCPCNAINQQHVSEIIHEYADKGVAFYAVVAPGRQATLPKALAGMQPLSELPGSDGIPASPAVAIWDQHGQLAYFGPYSEGLVCNAANSFIEPILKALLDGRPVQAPSTLGYGCFCDWHAAQP